jgi:STE24 endopeptidase
MIDGPTLESLWTSVFAAAWLATLILQIWLRRRQIVALRRARHQLPDTLVGEIDPAAQAKAADYGTDRCRLAIVEATGDAGLLLALTLGGGLQWLSSLVPWWPPGGVLHGTALVGLVGATYLLYGLPFAWYSRFVVEERHGFNRSTPMLFVADQCKAALVAALLGLPLTAAALTLMQAAGDHWWLWVWLLWATFSLLLVWAFPVVIAPLFNRFRPLDDKALAERVNSLLTRCGFKSGGLFVMDGSRRSAHGNAYFTGIGDKRRIVFFDTLLERLTPVQVEAVLAHELGHFHHRHAAQRVALSLAGSGVALGIAGLLRDAGWFFTGLGVTTATDAALLILFILVTPVLLFPLQPLFNGISRRQEFAADRFAVRHTSAEALSSALIRLYRDNAATLAPDPLHSLFFDSHPPALIRLQRIRASTP